MFSRVINWEQILNDFRLNPRNTFTPSIRDGFTVGHAQSLTIAFSAGADSVAALFFIVQYFLNFPEKASRFSLEILYVDHGISYGMAGNDREKIIQQYCARLTSLFGNRFFFRLKKIRADSLSARLKKSFERTSSLVRNKLFRKHAIYTNSVVVTGHTLSDWYETVIMRLNRGSSRYWPHLFAETIREISFLRPLIYLTREEVRTLCTLNGLPFWDDPENNNINFSRNKIRLTIPVMNPGGLRESCYLMALEKKAHVQYIQKLEDELSKVIVPRREYHISARNFQTLNEQDKFLLVESVLRRIGLYPVKGVMRDKVISGLFKYGPFICEFENYSSGKQLVIRRGRAKISLKEPLYKGESLTTTGKLVSGAYITQSYGSKLVKKILSEHQLSLRQRLSVPFYCDPLDSRKVLFIGLSVYGFRDYYG